MKICSECGAQNADHSYLCVQCGARLSGVSADAEADYTGDTDQIPPQNADSADDLLTTASDALADGRPRDAIEYCHRALALEPSYTSAFALLGMAYEESGEPEAALEAYNNVLRLDPSRSAERQKVNLLKLQILRREQTETPEQTQALWAKHAPLILAIAAALLVFVVGAFFIISARNAQRLGDDEQAYEAAMAAGNEAMADGRYDKAESHFAVALRAKPDDEAAQTRLDNARKWKTEARASQTAQIPKWLPSKGPNPFRPVIIPATKEDEPLPTAAPPFAPSPVVSSSLPRTVHGSSREGSRTTPPSAVSQRDRDAAGADDKSPSPISPRADSQPVKPAETTTPAVPDTEQERGPGEITIWTSDKPATSPKPKPPAADPRPLREKADQLSSQKRYKEASETYGAAIEAYRQQMESNPQSRAAAQAAIDTLNRKRQLCDTQQ
jgi:tetratricopeptide (TPR) repeat protein